MKSTPSINELVETAIRTGNWMLRRSSSGRAVSPEANGFCWSPIGEWTEAPDWDPSPRCGGGLHGCGPQSSGFYTSGRDIDFCLVDDVVDIDGEKLKCRRAMVLLRNALPEGLSVGGYLDLEGTQITALPEGLSVGRSLYLRGTQITALPEGLNVGGYLDLRGTQITALPEGLSVGRSLYLRGTQITALPEGLSVGGYLDLEGTQITALPEGLSVGRSLYLRGTQITALPEGLNVGGEIIR